MNFGGKLLDNKSALEELPEIMPVMRRVALVDNPASGLYSSRRNDVVRAAKEAFESAGIEVEHLTIDGPGSGRVLAREAVARGCDSVIVCGGDGTVHEVLQALVGTEVALGVVPMGTANALASNLGLSKSPAKAIQKLLTARPVQVPVGRILYRTADGAERSQYFTVAAGVGADALLMARMDPVRKKKWGYLLYLVEAFRIWASHPFPLFQVRLASNGNGRPQVVEASQILAVRVRSFGGVLGTLAPGATLHSDNLCLLAFKTRSRFRYMRFLLAVLGQRHSFSRDVELLKADTVECMPANGSSARVYVEADGEALGHLPARIEIASKMLTLLIPPDAQP
ncbi:MAG TPA: diacylglycerol kinase family protein [Terracidiphilus sp.]|jgi:diacylglycerol kinase family enzyme